MAYTIRTTFDMRFPSFIERPSAQRLTPIVEDGGESNVVDHKQIP